MSIRCKYCKIELLDDYFTITQHIIKRHTIKTNLKYDELKEYSTTINPYIRKILYFVDDINIKFHYISLILMRIAGKENVNLRRIILENILDCIKTDIFSNIIKIKKWYNSINAILWFSNIRD